MDPMRRLLAAVSLVMAVSFAASAQPAYASCAQQTLSEQAAHAEVVVFGTVTSIRTTFAAASPVIMFRPERVLKGTLTKSVQVYLGPTHGGAVTSVDYRAASPEEHTLYLRDAHDGSYETDACSGSHDGAPSSAEQQLLGAGTRVDAAVDAALPAPLVAAVAVAVAVLAAALGIGLALRRRPNGR